MSAFGLDMMSQRMNMFSQRTALTDGLSICKRQQCVPGWNPCSCGALHSTPRSALRSRTWMHTVNRQHCTNGIVVWLGSKCFAIGACQAVGEALPGPSPA